MPHSSPIFAVQKKNSDDQYTGKDHRVVIGCRLIKNALSYGKKRENSNFKICSYLFLYMRWL